MGDKAWKNFERRIASEFGGVRRGPDTRGEGGGKTDIIHPYFAIECKLLGAPSYADMLAACRQAEKNAERGQEPVAVIKRKNKSMEDTPVIYRLPVFKAWRLGDG